MRRALLILLIFLTYPVYAKEMAIEVMAFVGGRDRLVIQDDTLYWRHLVFPVVGISDGRNEPTVVSTFLNGKEILHWHRWYPKWDTSQNGVVPSGSESFSFVFSPSSDQGYRRFRLLPKTARGSIFVVQQPAPENEFTAIIEFDDSAIDGADFYTAKFIYSSEPRRDTSPKLYKWVDPNGKIHYSDKKRDDKSEQYQPKSINKAPSKTHFVRGSDNRYFEKENFIMPEDESPLGHQFIMTSQLLKEGNKTTPVDTLRSIRLRPGDESFSFYVSLTNIVPDAYYDVELRVVDAKDELVSVVRKTLRGTNESDIDFSGSVFPKGIHESGDWDFKCIVNGKTLFFHRRKVYFR